MGAIELDWMAWPQVRAELDTGRDWESVEMIALRAVAPPGSCSSI